MLVNFRIGAHDLEIETGRHRNSLRENRKCKVCISNSIEDENHFLLNCDFTLIYAANTFLANITEDPVSINSTF